MTESEFLAELRVMTSEERRRFAVLLMEALISQGPSGFAVGVANGLEANGISQESHALLQTGHH